MKQLQKFVIAAIVSVFIYALVHASTGQAALKLKSQKKVDFGDQTVTIPALDTPDFSAVKACPVVRIIDGDTIKVQESYGTMTTVRLIGIDTPETKHPSKPVQYYGKEASAFTTNLLKGEKVYLVADPTQGETDKYGRRLAYVYRAPDGLFVNAEIIRQGYGHAYTKYPNQHMAAFRQLEKFARNAKKGLWDKRAKSTADLTLTKKKTIRPVATPAVQPKPESGNENVAVYTTTSGRKYHRSGCSYLSRSKIKTTLGRAKGSYGPCGRCKPPR